MCYTRYSVILKMRDIELLHHSNPEYRVTAVELLCNLANILGKEVCEECVPLEINYMSNDPSPIVRKTTAINIIKIFQTVSSKFFHDKLLPIYRKFIKDKVHTVREASVRIISDVARILDQHNRETLLIEIYKEYCKDESHDVRRAAKLQLGHLIFALKGSKIDPFLIQLYISLNPKLTNDKELVYHCAYTVPAVLLTLGEPNWIIVQTIYKTLVCNPIPIVRQTLAASIHEVA